MFSASAAAASSFLTSRRRCVVQRFNLLRSFSTQILTRDYEGSSNGERRRPRVPILMVPSRYHNPRSCSLFSLCRTTSGDGRDGSFFRLEPQVLHLPESAAADTNVFIGCSEGIIFTSPGHNHTKISAVDPLAGTHLALPSTVSLMTCKGDGSPSVLDLHDCRPVTSPSRDTVAISRHCYLHFARVGDGRWTQLPTFGYITDVIFHKGRLYAVDYDGLVGVYDLRNPSSPSLVGNDCLAWEEDCFSPTWLVESPDGEDLFLVYRHSRGFKVFKLNQRGKWTRVRSIGDLAIFIGMNQSVSVQASRFPDILKPNSIYFTRHLTTADSGGPSETRGVGIYSLDDPSFQFLRLTNGQEQVLLWPSWPPSVWFISATTS